MKVKELLEQLQKLPDDKNIYIYNDGYIDEINATALTIPRYLDLCSVDLLKENGDLIDTEEYDTCLYKEYQHDFDGLLKINPNYLQYCKQIVVISPQKNLDRIIADNKYEVDVKYPEQFQLENDEEIKKEELEFQEFIRLSKKFVNKKVPKKSDELFIDLKEKIKNNNTTEDWF